MAATGVSRLRQSVWGHFHHFVVCWLLAQIGANIATNSIALILNQRLVSCSYAALYLQAASMGESHQERCSILLNADGLIPHIDETRLPRDGNGLAALRQVFDGGLFTQRARQALKSLLKPTTISALTMQWMDAERNELIHKARKTLGKKKS